MAWNKGPIVWEENNALCISVVFTWDLPVARGIILSNPNSHCIVGGPAVRLLPKYLDDIADIETIVPSIKPMYRYNKEASRTTLGCPNNCSFCGVRRIEGEYKELDDWEPHPILCDSNFLACSDAHFNKVIDRLKIANFPSVDFNQALEAKLLTRERARRLSEINITPRFAWDRHEEENYVFDALHLMEEAGISRSKMKAVLSIVGYNETPEEALYRMETLRSCGYLGFPIRYQPLDSLKKNSYDPPQWGQQELKDFCRYWSKQRWFGGITYDEYRSRVNAKEQLSLFNGAE